MSHSPWLPEQFADLEPFAHDWALPTGAERYERRLHSSMEALQAFYDAVFPRAEEMLSYLDGFELEDLPESALHLMWLLYSLSVVSLSVDIFRQQKVPESGKTHLEFLAEPVP